MTLPIDFVPYSPMTSNNVKLRRQRGLLFYIEIFNRTLAENYINISNRESLFEYYIGDNFGWRVIKYIVKPFGL